MSEFACEKCGRSLEAGDWPFCAGGHGRGKSTIVTDDIPGGLVMEHVEPGRRVYSKTELKQVLRDHRSHEFPQGARLSEEGWRSETDQHLTRWRVAPAPFIPQEQRRSQMAAWLGMSIEEFDLTFPA